MGSWWCSRTDPLEKTWPRAEGHSQPTGTVGTWTLVCQEMAQLCTCR